MKARNLAAGVVDLQSLAQDSLALTQEIIDRCGPRLAGSHACHEAAKLLSQRLQPFCDRTTVEPFDVRPDAFLGFMRVTGVFYLLGTVFVLASKSLPAAICFTIGALVTIFEFLLYREVLDPFFPRRVGHNVVATIEPEGKASRQLIFAGHHDSARVFNLLCYLPRLYRLRLVGAFVTVLSMPLVTWFLAACAKHRIGTPIVVFDCVMGLIFLLPMWFFLGKEGTPGAGDNLIASAMLVSIARVLRSAGGALRNTRVIFFSSDAEESGLRGARAFVRQHRAELCRLPTTLLNVDSVYSADCIQFISSDLNGLVALNGQLANQCVQIAKNLGVSARTFRMYPGTGATDAAEFAKIGVKATTLIALPTDVESADLVYHTPNDIVANIQPAAVEACLGIAFGVAGLVEHGGVECSAGHT